MLAAAECSLDRIRRSKTFDFTLQTQHAGWERLSKQADKLLAEIAAARRKPIKAF